MDKKPANKNPFGLIKKESRTLAATVGTETLNNDNYKTPASLESDAVVNPAAASADGATVPEPPNDDVAPVVAQTAVAPTSEPAPAITENIVDTVSNQETTKRVGGETEPKAAKGKKKPGPKKNPETGETTLTRISVRSNQILNLLCTIEGKTHIEFLDDLLASHPLYNKVKGLL